MLNPSTGEEIKVRETAGGNFLYRFHFELYGIDRTIGRWIVGVVSMMMFVANPSAASSCTEKSLPISLCSGQKRSY